jgi:D-alanine-D-alanine ligase-like ATP-grasp enzyme
MLDALAEFMPNEVHWTHPEGGLFVWATLPSYVDATSMLPRAISRNVAYVPGEGFFANGGGKNHMRINFSFVEPKKIRRGIELLSEVIRERMELRSDLARGVKPAREGSGLGLTRVEEPDALLEAVYEAFGYDGKIILESWVTGTEITAPILEPAGSEPRVLNLVEVRPRGGSYDFEAKYTPGATDFAIPAEVPEESAVYAEETALSSYQTLACYGFARVDMILEGDTPWVLDAKTIPGFTETSTLPLAAEAAGISFENLVEIILDSALQSEAPAKL